MDSYINIHVKSMAWGWQEIEISSNQTTLNITASYMGADPLGDLIKIVMCFYYDEEETQYFTTWYSEPDKMELSFIRDTQNINVVHIKAVYGEYNSLFDEKPTQIIQEYRFDVTLDELKKAVIKEALRVLKEYGIRGYDGSWMSEEGVFPIRALLILLDSPVSFDEETDSYHSNIKDELQLLLSLV